MEYCNQHGIAVEAYSPLAQAKSDRLNDPVILATAKRHGKDSAQILIRWSLQKGLVRVPEQI